MAIWNSFPVPFTLRLRHIPGAFFIRSRDGTPAIEACHQQHSQEVENMAWRPTQYLLNGELNNMVLGRVTGWMRFAGLDHKVTFDLKGDFHRDIRGARIRFTGDGDASDPTAASYMEDFNIHQKGKVGDITAGLPPHDLGIQYPYIEWYAEHNGRVVIELSAQQVQVLGTLRPWADLKPISRQEQANNMAEFLGRLAEDSNATAIAIGPDGVIAAVKPKR